ncbi:MAG TPA: ABC transporter ATP-binding protein [Acidimicrobiales bacterium]|jgi:branched-chain amino acid transport system ATP-binding protein|nr:ABC transporter ATP-binding protein [Acidimicrobiales bacterium]
MAVLEARNLDVRFGELHAVRDVSLGVDRGEILGLIGPNGAGKTTTFNAVSGVQRCTGTVVLDGVDVSKAAPDRRARLGMSRTFQRLEVFGSMTAYDNIRTAAEIAARGRRQPVRSALPVAERVIDLVGLRDQADRRADALPTGQARLVELGRVLATGPKVVLLDEPASGLDDVETERLARVLDALRADGMAVLLVEHDIDLVMGLCSRVCVLNLGEVIASGTPAEVRGDAAVQEAYLGAAV